jgi:nucleotide-binding universal stress UspA family protein
MIDTKTIIVALDLTEMDEALFRFAGYFGNIPAVEQLYFTHIIPTLVLPQGVKDLVHSVISPGFHLDETVKNNITEEVDEKLNGNGKAKYSIVVEEGQPFKNLVNICKETRANLLLVGKKKDRNRGGVVAKMVARMVDCDVCFVTNGAIPEFSNILVPMDFSQNSIRALQAAKDFIKDKPGAKITALHVLDYPPTAQYLSRKYGLLAPDWEARLEEAFDKCLAQYQIPRGGVEFISRQNEYFNTAQHLMEYAGQHNNDIIIMGAKGHHSFDDLFLGSVAEKLVTIDDTVPVLIVR